MTESQGIPPDRIDRQATPTSASPFVRGTPIVLGLLFWSVLAAYWFFLFRRPEAFRGSFLELVVLVLFPGGLVYLGTVVGFVVSLHLLRSDRSRPLVVKAGLVLCGAASFAVAGLVVRMAAVG